MIEFHKTSLSAHFLLYLGNETTLSWYDETLSFHKILMKFLLDFESKLRIREKMNAWHELDWMGSDLIMGCPLDKPDPILFGKTQPDHRVGRGPKLSPELRNNSTHFFENPNPTWPMWRVRRTKNMIQQLDMTRLEPNTTRPPWPNRVTSSGKSYTSSGRFSANEL